MRHISTWHHPILKANHLLHFFLIPLFHRQISWSHMAKRQVRSKAMPQFLSRSLQFDFQLPVPAREDLQADGSQNGDYSEMFWEDSDIL
jgi:hypothetical protein